MTIEKVKELLADHLEVEADSITAETTFESLGADSLEIMEILMEAEDEFGIEIDVASAGKTVGSLVTYIDSKLA